mmetsp:Transcript_38853/g.102574  ORF Transcript_38853/g.102574 Transcript_38853/m.102574 type:complete len:144 (-) Transcript_38853:92-523(-)
MDLPPSTVGAGEPPAEAQETSRDIMVGDGSGRTGLGLASRLPAAEEAEAEPACGRGGLARFTILGDGVGCGTPQIDTGACEDDVGEPNEKSLPSHPCTTPPLAEAGAEPEAADTVTAGTAVGAVCSVPVTTMTGATHPSEGKS